MKTFRRVIMILATCGIICTFGCVFWGTHEPKMGIAPHCTRRYGECVMYGTYGPTSLYDVPGFCDNCLTEIKNNIPNWQRDADCASLLFAGLGVTSLMQAGEQANALAPGQLTLPARRYLGSVLRPMKEFERMPRQIGGLQLELDVVKDTSLVGEPVMVEIFLRNVVKTDVPDPCLLNIEAQYLELYAIHNDSTACYMVPRGFATLRRPDHLILPPGSSVGSIALVGSEFVIYGGGLRGGAEIPHMYFRKPGLYKVFGTYLRLPEDYFQVGGERLGKIISNVDSFWVEQPHGEEAVLVDILPDSALIKGPEAVLEDLCSRFPFSVYTPYIQARYANSMVVDRRINATDYEGAIAVLEELVARWPGHRLAQEVEFDIGKYYCLMENAAKANQVIEELLIKYPQNARAYQICKGRQSVPRPDNTVRFKGGDEAGEVD